MAPQVGFEPTTKWLTATYSTIELLRIVNGVNVPITIACKAGMLRTRPKGLSTYARYAYLAFWTRALPTGLSLDLMTGQEITMAKSKHPYWGYPIAQPRDGTRNQLWQRTDVPAVVGPLPSRVKEQEITAKEHTGIVEL